MRVNCSLSSVELKESSSISCLWMSFKDAQVPVVSLKGSLSCMEIGCCKTNAIDINKYTMSSLDV